MSDKTRSDLYAEALKILAQSELLKQTVIWQDELVDKLCNKYSDAELDMMPEEEKLAHLAETEELCGSLNQSVKELKVLDAKYEALRLKVRAKYGKDCLPPVSGDIPDKINPEDEIDLL